MCKHLIGNGNDWYKCSLTKKKCKYQHYCSVKHTFDTDKCRSCPAFREK